MIWFISILQAVSGTEAAPLPRLVFPVACDPERCAIQKFVDHDPGPERRDFRCERRTTDGHDGTDIRLRSAAALGGPPVSVLAAADGAVLRVRDGMADTNAREAGGAAAVADRMAGNAVVIAHGGGVETQYSHLRRGSVTVRPGQRVAAGTPIGAIGMSGFAEFPHLHFTVRRDGRAIDPFDPADARCGDANAALWKTPLRLAQWAPHNDLLAIGVATGREDATQRRMAAAALPLPADPPALVIWAEVADVEAGATERFTLTGPGGAVLLDTMRPVRSPYLSWFAFAGVPRPARGWAPGRYEARYAVGFASRVSTLQSVFMIR